MKKRPLFDENALNVGKEGKSAIHLSNLGNFCQIWPSPPRIFCPKIIYGEFSALSGGGRRWDLGAQGGSAKAPARNDAFGGSTPRATRAWRKHALVSSETL